MDENNNQNTNNDIEPETLPAVEQSDSEFFGEEPHYQTPPEYSDYASTSGQSGSYQSSQSGEYQSDSYQSSQSGEYQSSGYQGGSQYQQYQARGEKPASKTLGILSLIFGIISIVFFCSCINIFTGILAIVFGIIQLVSGRGLARGMSIAGIITGALSIIFFFVFWGAILNNSDIRDSVMDRNSEDMEEFFEDYLEDYFDDFDIDINGGNVGPGRGNGSPNMDDATQL